MIYKNLIIMENTQATTEVLNDLIKIERRILNRFLPH
jgi:hypothetical protein